MNKNELIINGIVYERRVRYIKEDELWECGYFDFDDKVALTEDRDLVCYEYSCGKAKRELENLIKSSDYKYGIDNRVVLWRTLDAESQHQILIIARGVKRRLMGDWMSEDERFQEWREILKSITGINLPKSVYDRSCG